MLTARPLRRMSPFGLWTVLFLCLALAAFADDRSLLRANASDPYVFILLDTSGSMNWSPKCTQAQFDAGVCDFLCPEGDCYTPTQGDDPGSKMRQAKEALYEVLDEIGGVNFGFATYNQDTLTVPNKHWLYRATTAGPTIPGYGPWPAVGVQEVFGAPWTCNSGSAAGCNADPNPALLSDSWETARMRRFPKGNQPFNTTSITTFYVKQGGTVYKIAYKGAAASSYGSNLSVQVSVNTCTNTSCSSSTAVTGSPVNVTFQPISDFLSWDLDDKRTNPQMGFWPQGTVNDHTAAGTCNGWDPNTDSSTDAGSGYNIKFSTTTDPLSSFLNIGDVIPLDWRADHALEIQRRLAPNIRTNPAAVPDFRQAVYFNNNRSGADTFLRLKNSTQNVRPLMAEGSTPLANSIGNISDWFTGFASVASPRDPLWNCRQKFLIILTDGDESCSNDACGSAASKYSTAHLLSAFGVKTYVVAFGIDGGALGGGNKLNCMAANGGTTAPIFPQNKAELVQALTDIISQVREQSSAFASAAVPSVQADISDRIFLTSFTPLDKKPTWDGHLDAYLKPLPLTVRVNPNDPQLPDRSRICPNTAPGSPGRTACRLWDAGEVILGQAPTLASLTGAPNLDLPTLRLGTANSERRVFYPTAATGTGLPRAMRLFYPPTGDPATDPEWADLWAGLGIPAPTDAAERDEAVDQTKKIVRTNLGVKTAPKLDANGNPTGLTITYLLGDVFHADPLILDRPNDFFRFVANAGGSPNPDPRCLSPDRGYFCWALKHQTRRKMILTASNDGQLHAFDAGVFNSSSSRFTDGTGTELFSYMPRLALPLIREFGLRTRQIMGIDGSPAVGEVFIDTVHTGTPTAGEREWRTVVIGGFREGGRINTGGAKFIDDFVSGYYAIDLTQPDTLTGNGEDTVPTTSQVVPNCLTLGNTASAGCGTLPYPAVLWEFTDSIAGSRLDEDDTNSDGTADGNGTADLGQTWSSPTVTRIRVLDGVAVEERYVAIFGGGFDSENKTNPQAGNFLYMVDVETGTVIYKRQVSGSIAADPAVVDTDLDGFADRIYVGTTAGFLYKVDMRSPGVMGPVIIDKDRFIPPLALSQSVRRITDSSWRPFPIFDSVGKPIYTAAAPIFVQQLDKFAIGFGVGDREDLWNFGQPEGRYYLILDNQFAASQVGIGGANGLPKVESQFRGIAYNSAPNAASADFITNPTAPEQAGWFLRLAPDERVITRTFAALGVIVFSSFQPTITFVPGPPSVCTRAGESHAFLISFANGNPIVTGRNRYSVISKFVTNPYVSINSTTNPDPGSGVHHAESADQIDTTTLNALKRMLATRNRDCKFGNFTVTLDTGRSDTGQERYLNFPICFKEKNFKEY